MVNLVSEMMMMMMMMLGTHTDCAEHNVTAQAGGAAVLPCTCPSGQPPYLVWQKAAGEQMLVVYNYRGEDDKDDRAEEYRERTELTGNCSLKILSVTPSDQGLYQCYYQIRPVRQDDIYLQVTETQKIWTDPKTVATSSVCGLVVIVIITAAAAVYVGIYRKNRRQMNGENVVIVMIRPF
ncbi:hypothetical protein F2P79_017836 [Pimephales promelas]|nr:hypothetical protein F2P79_017836 [Pimephales promelas]